MSISKWQPVDLTGRLQGPQILSCDCPMICNEIHITARLINKDQTDSQLLSCLRTGHIIYGTHSPKESDTHWTSTQIAPQHYIQHRH